ncbi:MAG: FkbM family methyltransferase [Candidatus Sumerlaeia bacterium]|nr:FkbM family methyltransferase [Candidatus Sumerlaeia bacterium]
MQPTETVSPIALKFYTFLSRLRPITVGEKLKRILGIRRFPFRIEGGTIFHVDPVSNLGLYLLREGVYEPEMTGLLRDILRPGDVFVDVGANEGYFSMVGAGIVGEQGRVLAVEPQKRLHPVIGENIRANDYSGRVTLEACALMEKPGTIRLHLTPDVNTGATSTKRAYRHSNVVQEIEATTLDALAGKHGYTSIRLVKIDCEGAEPEILAGAGRLLGAGAVDYLLVEFHENFSDRVAIGEAHEAVVGHGYEYAVIDGMHRLYNRPGLALKGLPGGSGK